MVRDFLSVDLRDKGADTSCLLLTVPRWDLGARLSAQHLTVNLWHLDALELGHIIALLFGEAAALSVGGLGTLGSRNSLAFFLLYSIALPLLDIVALLLGHALALLLGHVPAFFGSDITALLLVVDLLADLSCYGITFLAIDSFAFLAVDSLTLLLVDYLTLSLSPRCALLFLNWVTSILESVATLLVVFSRAFLLMNSLSDSSWNADTLQLRDVVTLLILNCVTLLPYVLSSFAVFSELKSTLLTRNSLLDRPLGDLTFSFLNISTNSVWDVATLFLGHRLVCGLRDLVAHFLGNLSTYRFWWWSCPLNWRRVELKGQIRKGDNKNG